MKIEKLPPKFTKLWQKCLPLLKAGRPGDVRHAKKTVEFILNYRGKLGLDKDVLIPVAMMHDIGHSAILPRHFSYITGFKKIANGKLVHMLTGAKIASQLVKEVGYKAKLAKEIVEIISTHDFDQLQGVNIKEIYNSDNKKLFHDIDSLDRFNINRVKIFLKKDYSKENLEKTFKMLNNFLPLFYYQEIREEAEVNFKKLAKKFLK